MESKSKKLRSGYTTGACAAAAAKAAAVLLWNAECGMRSADTSQDVEIPFPDGTRVTFSVHYSEIRVDDGKRIASATVIKDAGDDPDVTHGAEIRAEVSLVIGTGSMRGAEYPEIVIRGGRGVGKVTKPGLAIAVGEAAINPVPRKMIREAVREAIDQHGAESREHGDNKSTGRAPYSLHVAISVPAGEELAKKTLNHRLGIVGGISILGTTGNVKPLSEAAWTATISSSFDVAKSSCREEVVLSTGRTSEKAHQKKYGLPEECYVMMGDYTEFSLHDASEHRFRKIHLCAQWAKMIKIAMSTPQTHVRHGALDVDKALQFLIELGIEIPRDHAFNTSREIYYIINSELPRPHSALLSVCGAAKRYCQELTSGIPVSTHLVSYEGVIVAESE